MKYQIRSDRDLCCKSNCLSANRNHHNSHRDDWSILFTIQDETPALHVFAHLSGKGLQLFP